MKVFAYIFTALFIYSAQVGAQIQPLDKVIAVIDKGVVLQSELDENLVQVIERAKANNMTLPDEAVLREQVLDHLISEKLQLQVADRVGYVVQDEQINQTIAQIQANNGLTPEAFVKQLQSEGLSLSDFRKKLRRDLTIQQIQQCMVQQRIQISPL